MNILMFTFNQSYLLFCISAYLHKSRFLFSY